MSKPYMCLDKKLGLTLFFLKQLDFLSFEYNNQK